MKALNLTIKNLEYPTIGRLESISYPKVGSIIYTFYGGVLCKNGNIDNNWVKFSIEKKYSIEKLKNDIFMNQIEVGDIVQFNPSKSTHIIYEKKSNSNALFLTEKCNSNCLICPQPSEHNQDYTDIAIATLNLINDPIKAIGITGGEPTVSWSGLIKLLSNLNNNHPDSMVELLSNARLFHQYEKAKELADKAKNRIIVCVPLYSDIYSIHDTIVGSKGAFWQTLEGIYNLEKFRIPIELRTVVIRQNYKRLNSWAEYVYRHLPFVEHIAIMGLEPIGKALDNIDKVWIDPVDYSNQLDSSVISLNNMGMKVSIYNHQLCTMPKTLWKYSRKSISEWKNSYLDECQICSIKYMCGGFFDSALNLHSRGIRPIKI